MEFLNLRSNSKLEALNLWREEKTGDKTEYWSKKRVDKNNILWL